MSAEDFTVREMGTLRPRLRDELRFFVQEQGGRRTCVIEDPAAARFHRVGLAEYRFLRALDGEHSVAAILALLAREGNEAFTEAEALHILRWLRDQRLLAVEGQRDRLTDREQRERTLQSAITWLNPLVCKIPLFRPDRFFSWLEPLVRPALGWVGFMLWLIVILSGAAHVGMNWRSFTGDAGNFFSRDNWLWVACAWTGLKIAHECSHGIFCKHYGAPVREAGILFVVFIPVGYIDATASLGLASRWRRIMVAAAGLYMEFFIAALAAIVWTWTSPGALHSMTHNVVIIGTVVTLFFNANPLMRFDGYYILSDLLEVPNLATRGRHWLHRAFGVLLLGGMRRAHLRPSTREGWIAAFYGCAAWLWQILVMAGVLLAGSATLRGGGLLLSVIAAITWVALPLVRFGQSMASNMQAGTGSIVGLVLRSAAIVLLGAGILFFPWRHSVTSDGVVELGDTQVLRAECPGFVLHDWVEDGALVSAGQLLVELGNDEAAAELEQSRFSLARQELRERMTYMRKEFAAFQAERGKTEALRREVAEHEKFLATLQIHAPFAGRVMLRKLGKRRGEFIAAGDEVLQIGQADRRELKLAVEESDEPHFRAAIGAPVQIRIDSRGAPFSGRLARMEMRATRHPVHPALTALFGGPLDLRPTDGPPAKGNSPADGYELNSPHFNATVSVVGNSSLAPGEIGHVRFRSTRTATLWGEAQTALERWWRKKSTANG